MIIITIVEISRVTNFTQFIEKAALKKIQLKLA